MSRFNLDYPPALDVRTQDKERLPPGQTLTKKWPVLHEGEVPTFDPATWSLRIFGLVAQPMTFTWDQFKALPRVRIISDFHCVTTWSRYDNAWEGVHTRELARLCGVDERARYVIQHCENEYTTNTTIEEFLDESVLLADTHDGQPLTGEHGGPLRVVAPRLYAWKSGKWVRGIEFSATDCRGFWEVRGYHNRADPWREQRYSYQETEDDEP
ncbi:MAG: sulfite oxidase-like oxidoreductase [Myxococcota bacterium]